MDKDWKQQFVKTGKEVFCNCCTSDTKEIIQNFWPFDLVVTQ